MKEPFVSYFVQSSGLKLAEQINKYVEKFPNLAVLKMIHKNVRNVGKLY